MVIGILQVELFIPGAQSLKDKRRVLLSLKDRIGKDIAVAIAEVDHEEIHQTARLGIATVSNSGSHCRSVLTKALDLIRATPAAVLTDHRLEVLSGQ